MFIVGAATAVGWFITSAQIPLQMAEFFSPLIPTPTLLLIAIMIFLFAAGMVMDLTPNILLFAPVFFPLVVQAGIDPYFFGLLFVLNVGIGVITPPVGTVLFVVCGSAGITMGHLVRKMAPVSYTHLDVYKRQAVDIELQECRWVIGRSPSDSRLD